MEALHRSGTPYFLFLNLYDVHAPYAPAADSPLRSFRTVSGWLENLTLPMVLPKISGHAYLRTGFRVSERSRRMLLARYHQAIELMDGKLGAFFEAAKSRGLLENTLLIVTSDHGEAFGEHGLYFHDASVYEEHLHVPLYVHHPEVRPGVVDDVVSTRDLHALMRAAGLGAAAAGTLLDPNVPRAMPVALAEHFHYPYVDGLLPQYRQNRAAAIVGHRKAFMTSGGVFEIDLERDPMEIEPQRSSVSAFAEGCQAVGLPSAAVAAPAQHLNHWEAGHQGSSGCRAGTVRG